MIELTNKSLEEIRKLRITQVQWFGYVVTLKITISDGQTCKAGAPTVNFDKSHKFNPSKKITKVECIIKKCEDWIIQINFFSGKQKLVNVGYSDYDVARMIGVVGRKEVFEIADDEQLIGCELDHENNFFVGVTWIKIKLIT